MASFVGDLEHIRELLDNLKVSCEETNQDEAVSALEEADAVLSAQWNQLRRWRHRNGGVATWVIL